MTAPLFLLALTLAQRGPDTTVRLPRGGAIEINTRRGNVKVSTGESDVVTILGGSAELDGNMLQVNGDERRDRGLEVTLPSWARVDVSSVSGNLTFSGGMERLHAATVSGSIHLEGGAGTIELETIAGAVVIDHSRAASLSIDATGGPVTVTAATGKISVENVNSSISLRGIRSDDVTAHTINAGIEFEGPLAVGGRYDFSSQNSDVTLELPGDVSARMKISTMNGQLVSPEIPATTTGTQDAVAATSRRSGKTKAKDKGGDDGEHTFTVVYGTGAAQVTVDVFNGNLVIVKKKP